MPGDVFLEDECFSTLASMVARVRSASARARISARRLHRYLYASREASEMRALTSLPSRTFF
jgi:hypothetical protein